MVRISWADHSMLTKHALVLIIEAAENAEASEEVVVDVAPGRIYSNKINPSQEVFNVTRSVVKHNRIKPDIYFTKVDSKTTKRVVKIR